MRTKTFDLKKSLVLFFCLFQSLFVMAQKDREYYEITVYHFKDASQEKVLDNYFQSALVPALHKAGIKTVGVFKSWSNDTVTDKLMYVFMPIRSLDEANKITNELQENTEYQTAGQEYLNAVYNNPPYTRMEKILLYAFPLAPKMNEPKLQGPKKDRVYELRSYESPTESYHANKVQMFNQGGEIDLFKRLNFNAIFYAQVVAGSKMPNLMYMTSFENMQDREAHWKAFGDDPFWKKLSAMPEYQNNVSHIDITFLHPTDYSDF
jgi:NIPSNAP